MFNTGRAPQKQSGNAPNDGRRTDRSQHEQTPLRAKGRGTLRHRRGADMPSKYDRCDNGETEQGARMLQHFKKRYLVTAN